MNSIIFSSPTVLLRRPVAEIISYLNEDYEIGLFTPYDLIHGFVSVHFNKIRKAKIHNYPVVNGVYARFFEWEIPINPLYFIRFFKILRKYDIIHMWVPFYISHISIAIIKYLFFPYKKLYLTMDTFPGLSFSMGKFMDKIFKLYYRTIGKIVFLAANKIIIYGNSMKKFAIEAGISKKKIEVISPGVRIAVREADKDIREEFNIDRDEKIILFIGLLNHRKGIDILLKIAREFRTQSIRFIIVGDSAKKQMYEELAKKLNIKEKVIFTGFRNDIHNFYCAADIFFLPSRGEGFAGVLFESMAYGVPIIASNINGTKDVIQNNESGFLCNLDDIECFVKKIKILLHNKEIQKRFIKNAKERILTNFNWDKNILNFKKLYE